MKRHLIFLLLWSSSINLYAQIENPIRGDLLSSEAPILRFQKYGIEDGLAQGSVRTIMQDKQGFIWMGTQSGLHRYDGYDFKLFSNDPFDTTSLPGSWIEDLFESYTGDIWVATRNSGLSRFDPTSGKSVHFKHDPNDSTSISSNTPQVVFESSTGDLWVSSNSGLNRMSKGDEGRFMRYLHDPQDPSSIASNVTTDIAEDHEGHIWVGTANGLSKIDPKSNSIINYMHEPGRAIFRGDSLNIIKIYIPDNSNKVIWLGTPYGLVQFDPVSGKHQRYLVHPEEELSKFRNTVFDISPDPNDPNILWVTVARMGGIARFDIRTKQFTSYKNNPLDENSLSTNNTNTIFTDRSGLMWVGLEPDGVHKFNPGAVNFNHIRNDPKDPASLAPGFVWGIYEDSKGSLWVSTVGETFYLTQFDASNDRIVWHVHDPDDANTLLPRRQRVFAEDTKGRLWIGGPAGLNLMDTKTGEVKRYLRETTDENNGLNNIQALKTVSGEENKLWVGTAGGLDVFDTDTGIFTSISLGLDSTSNEPRVWYILQGSQGSIWLSTSIGLIEINSSGKIVLKSSYNPNDRSSISSNGMLCILERSREPGILWLASLTGTGLDRFDTQTGIVTHISIEDGLPSKQIYGIMEDSEGVLWMSTNNGISSYNPDAMQFRNYGLDEGLLSLEYNSYAYAKGNNGVFYFGNISSVTAFTPELLIKNDLPPQVAINEVIIPNRSEEASINAKDSSKPGGEDPLTIEYDENEVTINFVALHYGNPKKNQYAYKLEGFDPNWIESGTKRSATYTNLPPGDFIFQVKASNADGVWNEQAVSIALQILPPWYRTWWAYGLFGLIFVTGIFLVDRFQRRRLLKKEREKTQQKELEQAKQIEKAYSELKSTQSQLIHSEKMASLGELTAGIAHEIQNPLNFVNNFSEVNKEMLVELRDAVSRNDQAEIETILKDLEDNEDKVTHHGKRAEQIVKSMLQHSRTGSGEKELTDINALCDEYLRLAYHGFRAKDKDFNADFKLDLDPALPKVEVVPQEIGRVLLNLINNAFQAVAAIAPEPAEGAKAGGNYKPLVTVTTKLSPFLKRGLGGVEEGHNSVVITVSDNGPGIPDDIKDKIFQPFFTTKPTGEGTGLGLSMSYDIVTKGHGGELKVETEVMKGSKFVIMLPAITSA